MDLGFAFVTPVWRVKNDYTRKELKELRKWALEYERTHQGTQDSFSSRGGYHSTYSTEFEDIPNFGRISAKLNFLPKFGFQSWWMNVNRKGDYNINHIHPGSNLSLVWYLTDNNESLYLEGSQQHSRYIFEKMFKDQGLFDQQISINCKAGDMVLFPADVPHHVEAHQLESPRISIAMNLAFVLN